MQSLEINDSLNKHIPNYASPEVREFFHICSFPFLPIPAEQFPFPWDSHGKTGNGKSHSTECNILLLSGKTNAQSIELKKKRRVGEWTKRQRGKGKYDYLSLEGIDAPASYG